MNLNWTCPGCQTRNSSIVARDAEPGSIVAVHCPACLAQHQASIVIPRVRAGDSAVGVVWI